MDDFGSLLRNKRKQKSVSLQNLSDSLSEMQRKREIGWYPDVSQLSRWETGRAVPRARHRPALLAIAGILAMDDMERNELLVRAGLSPLQPGELDIDAMLSELGPERSRKTWFLRKTLGWDEKRVANKLGIPFWDVRSDIKEAEKELQRLSGKTEIHELVQALNKRVDESKEHSDTVLHILEIYANQLEVSYEPEDFLTELNSKVSNEKESDYWLYVRDIFPSIDRLIDRQMDSESLVITSPLEEEPTFALLEGHYKDTKLWEDISKCKQAMNTYVNAGLKLRKIVMSELCPLLQGIGQANLFLEGLREMVRAELAPVRVKLHLEGMLTDRVLEQLPDDKLLKQFHGFAIGFVNRYKNKVEVEDDSKNNVQEEQNKGEMILELLDKLVKNYELMKRLNKAIVRGVEEEKLKGMLPPGTKCKFCLPITQDRGITTGCVVNHLKTSRCGIFINRQEPHRFSTE